MEAITAVLYVGGSLVVLKLVRTGLDHLCDAYLRAKR